MATDVTVGLDPFDRVIRVNFDNVETRVRVQAELDEVSAEQRAADIMAGARHLDFIDTITGQPTRMPIEGAHQIAGWLREAAMALRSHNAGEVDLRLTTGKVPKA